LSYFFGPPELQSDLNERQATVYGFGLGVSTQVFPCGIDVDNYVGLQRCGQHPPIWLFKAAKLEKLLASQTASLLEP
jgi:hypothetical protein